MSANDFPLTSPSGKPYRKETRDGKEVLVYESGTVLDADTLKLVEQNKDHAFTSQSASEAAVKRWESARDEFERGAIEQVDGHSPADAQFALGKALMKRAINPFSSNGVAAAERIAQFTGWVRDNKRGGEDTPPPGTVRISATAMVSVAELRAHMARKYGVVDEQEDASTSE